jgi:hypothetical protein
MTALKSGAPAPDFMLASTPDYESLLTALEEALTRQVL